MAALQDAEFGTIKVRRSPLASQVRLKLDSGGAISISMPRRAPLYLARQLLEQSRLSLRRNLQTITSSRKVYKHGDIIGKSHRLRIEPTNKESSVLLRSPEVIVLLPHYIDRAESIAQDLIKTGIEKALRQQAKAFLPRRLKQLALNFGFNYNQLRFSSAGTRWGSCSNQKTISLNIWLMQLPFELIDYVIIHELCHTKHLNHSPEFWDLVQQCSPNYKLHRRTLKTHQPYA